jgi:AraC family transcriptional regulator
VIQTGTKYLPGSHELSMSSEGLNWSNIFVSVQHEQPYDAFFAPLDDHMICVHRDGPVTVTRDLSGARATRSMMPGSIFLMPAGRDFRVELDRPLSSTRIYVSDELFRRTAEELTIGDPGKIEIYSRIGTRDALIEEMSRTLTNLMAAGLAANQCVDSISHVLALQLLMEHSTASIRTQSTHIGLNDRQIRIVDDFIMSRLSEPLKIVDLAGAVRLSPTHFARQFKRAKGTSPHKHLLNTRIAAAQRLLHSDLAIAEVAFRCGFSHQEHLTTVFKRMMGVTPAVYRAIRRS